MKQEIKDYECPYCHKHFLMKRGGFSNHMRFCKDNPNSNYEKQKISIKQKQFLEKQKQLDKDTKKEYIFICKECKKEYKLILSYKQYKKHKYSNFCSVSCAHKYSSHYVKKQLKEAKCIDCGKIIYIKNRASDKTCRCKDCKKQHKIDKEPIKICKVCGKQFKRRNASCCSKECSKEFLYNRKKYLSEESIKKLQNAGKKSAQIQSELRRSKNEIEFCTLCENYFTNVEHNKPIFNGWDADIIIHDIKFAILWNGKVHYEPIFGQANLDRVISRDKIKLKEIQNTKYIPYIIKDIGKHNDNFVQEKFDEFIKYIKENNYYKNN